VDLQVELLCEIFVAMWTSELRKANMDHFYVLVQISFLRETGLALLALIWTLTCVSSQVLKKLTHRKYCEAAFMLYIFRIVSLKWLLLNIVRIFDRVWLL
jgi:hypothetical protein